MVEQIRFPHAGTLAIALLNANLPSGLTAYKRVPASAGNPTPSEFIVVTVAGGIAETLITNAAQLVVDGYAATDARAYEICDVALSILRSADGLIRGARGFSYPQNLPDPATNQIRYTSTGDVRVWGAAASA
jgi:hypothetical protein